VLERLELDGDASQRSTGARSRARIAAAKVPLPAECLAHGIQRAAMSPAASGGRTVERVSEEDFWCAA